MNRKEILQQLSDGVISREEAERRLAELGSPVPSELSAPPATPGTNKGASGCLIAAVITGVILLLLLGLLVVGLFMVRVSSENSKSHMERMERMHQVETEFQEAILQQSGSRGPEIIELEAEEVPR
jgi:hypothetical protein